MKFNHVSMLLLLCTALSTRAGSAVFRQSYDRSNYEEPAGLHFRFDLNPADSIYGIRAGDGTWITNTWILGEYFFTTFSNGLEDGFFIGAGLTIRLIPRSRIAPFIGGGGSYNQVVSRYHDASTPLDEVADSYGAGIAEAGIRFNGSSHFFELGGSYNWSTSSRDDMDYALLSLGAGIHF